MCSYIELDVDVPNQEMDLKKKKKKKKKNLVSSAKPKSSYNYYQCVYAHASQNHTILIAIDH